MPFCIMLNPNITLYTLTNSTHYLISYQVMIHHIISYPAVFHAITNFGFTVLSHTIVDYAMLYVTISYSISLCYVHFRTDILHYTMLYSVLCCSALSCYMYLGEVKVNLWEYVGMIVPPKG